jgi:hypothetical protein
MRLIVITVEGGMLLKVSSCKDGIGPEGDCTCHKIFECGMQRFRQGSMTPLAAAFNHPQRKSIRHKQHVWETEVTKLLNERQEI